MPVIDRVLATDLNDTTQGTVLVDWLTAGKGQIAQWVSVVAGSQLAAVAKADEPEGGMPGGGQCVRFSNSNATTRPLLDCTLTAVDMRSTATIVECWVYHTTGFTSPLQGVSINVCSGGSVANRYAKVDYPSGTDVIKGWHLYSFPLASISGSLGMSATGTPNVNAINYLRMGLENANAPYEFWAGPIRFGRRARIKVAVSNDDGNSGTYVDALPLLSARNIKITCAVNTGTIGTAGKMTLTQLVELRDVYGWTIASHCVSHTNLVLGGLTEAQKRAEIVDSRKWIVDNGFFSQCVTWPGGAYDLNCIDYAKEAGYSHAYDIGTAIKSLKDRVTCAENWAIYRFGAENTGGAVAAITNLDEAIRVGGHFHIYFHLLTAGASGTNTTNTTEFTTMLDALVRRRNLGLIDIVTAEELINQFSNGRA